MSFFEPMWWSWDRSSEMHMPRNVKMLTFFTAIVSIINRKIAMWIKSPMACIYLAWLRSIFRSLWWQLFSMASETLVKLPNIALNFNTSWDCSLSQHWLRWIEWLPSTAQRKVKLGTNYTLLISLYAEPCTYLHSILPDSDCHLPSPNPVQ